MAFLPLAATHYREAQSLFRRRQQLLNAPASPRESLRQLDWRLMGNLQGAMSHCAGTVDDGMRPAALFVECWCLLHEGNIEEVAAQLDALYPALDDAQQQAVLVAVRLAKKGCNAALAQPALRVAMGGHAAVAQWQEEADGADERVAAVLQWRDADGDSVEAFRPFYHDPDKPKAQRQALIGGLIRGDAAAFPVARDFPEDPVLVLLLARQGEAGNGPLAMALTGTAEAAESLLAMMDQVETAGLAAQAWFWLAGEPVPLKPRLQAVGEAASSSETMPDADAARQQWQTIKARAGQSAHSVFFGMPTTASSLSRLSEQWCGQVSALIDAHRSVESGRGIAPDQGWQHHSLHGGCGHV